MNVPLLIVAAGAVVLGWVWALRYAQLRTWRTVAVLAVGTAGLFTAALILPMPFGLLVGTAVGTLAFWLVATGSRFLWAMPDRDYAYAEMLRTADSDAAALLSRLAEHELDAVGAGLEPILEGLKQPAPDADWERVRDLKAEELGIALAFVTGRSPVPESTLRRQQELRDRALEEFKKVTKAKSSFWR